MILFPAVDLKGGRAVRLKQGKADDESVFFDSPLDAARHWQELGAEWLHLIDLDGAFTGKSENGQAVREICSSLGIPVQLGGGIRTPDAADYWFDAGVERIIIGTLALEQPDVFSQICKRHSGRVGVSLDAVGTKLKSRGWVKDAGRTLDEVIPAVTELGASFIIYTDIERDGMHKEINLEMTEHVASLCSIPLLVAGGVSTMESITALYPISLRTSLSGVISGRAIYEGTLDFADAVRWLQSRRSVQQ